MFNAETQRREVRREVLSWGYTPDPLVCVKNTKG